MKHPLLKLVLCTCTCVAIFVFINRVFECTPRPGQTGVVNAVRHPVIVKAVYGTIGNRTSIVEDADGQRYIVNLASNSTIMVGDSVQMIFNGGQFHLTRVIPEQAWQNEN
jgi:hypothetical protein